MYGRLCDHITAFTIEIKFRQGCLDNEYSKSIFQTRKKSYHAMYLTLSARPENCHPLRAKSAIFQNTNSHLKMVGNPSYVHTNRKCDLKQPKSYMEVAKNQLQINLFLRFFVQFFVICSYPGACCRHHSWHIQVV